MRNGRSRTVAEPVPPKEVRPSVPTQRDVARLAGVSPITVSRTLAGGENVSAALREQVVAAARQLGYLPNENARGLRPGQRSGLIGVAITDVGNSSDGAFAAEIEEAARRRGRYILLGSTTDSESRESELVESFLSRRVEGIVLIPTGQRSVRSWLSRLDHVPLVSAVVKVDDLNADCVLANDVAVVRLLTGHVGTVEHSFVALIGDLETVSIERSRLRQLQRDLLQAGVAVLRRPILRGADPYSQAAAHTRDLLQSKRPPSAILAATNSIAHGVLREYELRSPQEGALLDLPPLIVLERVEKVDHRSTSVRAFPCDARELGRVAAGALFDRIDRLQLTSPRELVVPAHA